jgi:multimeric flavodoxin WrbA
MKVVGIVGSPREGGNTEDMTKLALEEIQKEGLETELVTLAGKKIAPCDSCYACLKSHKCKFEGDDFEPIYQKLAAAEGMILATPVYYGAASPQMTAFLSRTYSHGGSTTGMQFENKVGGAIVVAGDEGKTSTFSQLLLFFMCTGVIVPGSSYWNIAIGGRDKGRSLKDEASVANVKTFGKRLAWLAKKVNS